MQHQKQNYNLQCNHSIKTSLFLGNSWEVAPLSRLESFQLKGLRKILGMTTTYINCANTNEEVFRRANLHIAANHFRTKIVPLQDIVTHRRIALVAKILRQDNPALWEWSVSKKIPPHLLRHCFDGSADAGNNGRKTPWLWYGAKCVMTKVISTTPTHNLLKYCKQLSTKKCSNVSNQAVSWTS